MIELDGSFGEGGGQILRTALGLSAATGTPFRISNIRARRPKPGLRPQHLAAVRAAAAICGAHVSGDTVGSQRLQFVPGTLRPGTYAFDTGTAGSAPLVFQAILPALFGGAWEITFRGGTHNPGAPPLPFLERAFDPLLTRMGAAVKIRPVRAGFFPKGGGEFAVRVRPAALRPLHLRQRGPVRRIHAVAAIAGLPDHIAERELDVVKRELDADGVVERHPIGPGNAVVIVVECAQVTEVFTAFGRRGVPAERVAGEAVRQTRAYLDADVPVDEHLADQLLLPLALAGGGSFRTVPPSEHTKTNAEVIRMFLGTKIDMEGDVLAISGTGAASGAFQPVERKDDDAQRP